MSHITAEKATKGTEASKIHVGRGNRNAPHLRTRTSASGNAEIDQCASIYKFNNIV